MKCYGCIDAWESFVTVFDYFQSSKKPTFALSAYEVEREQVVWFILFVIVYYLILYIYY